MAIPIAGYSGNLVDVDSNKNVAVTPGYPVFPAAGGWYSVTGASGSNTAAPSNTAVIAAGLAASTVMMSFRLSGTSTRKAYVDRMRVLMTPGTVGASAGVAGVLGLQRFKTAAPTGGFPRVAAGVGTAPYNATRKNATLGTASDVTDIRDLNAALTLGSAVADPNDSTYIASTMVPLFTTGGSSEWLMEFDNPIVLTAGDGIWLRNPVAMAATQTWVFSYNIYWHEI